MRLYDVKYERIQPIRNRHRMRSVKKFSPQNGGFIRAKLARPRTFCAKANGNF